MEFLRNIRDLWFTIEAPMDECDVLGELSVQNEGGERTKEIRIRNRSET